SESRALNARFNTALGIVGLAGALLMGALSWWGTKRALAPLDIIAERAEQVTVHGLGKSLVVSDAPVEVHGLVLSINHMLRRLGESFEALDQFSSNIAHELRTPLNAMKLQTEVTLTRDRPEEEYRESLHQTLIEINRLQRMVTDMLFIARADRGMYSTTLENVCVEDDLRDTVDYFNVAASEKDQSIEVSGTLRAMCDRSMMRRAVTNLLSNAIRYAPNGARIAVNLSSTDDEAIIRVSNPSRPYTALEIERFFDRFARNEEDKRSQTDGLGLGLAIVRSIMQLHGGSASARPTDTGIEFTLRWPLISGGVRIPESMIEFPKSA
ncbi:MAG: heavy metal sensor histidine kinase, partial [Burkholderiaceae bacterium]